MTDLSTYSLRDFIPFTKEVYLGLFERHNEALWPAQLPAILLGLVALWLAWSRRTRWLSVILAICWVWVGVTFHLARYDDLNWAASYFGWAFIVQGALVLASGWRGHLSSAPGELRGQKRDEPPDRRMAGARDALSISARGASEYASLALALFGLLLYPFIRPLSGWSWTGVELFGIAPDPTAIATLGVLLMAGRPPWLLLPIPFLWCLVSGATLWALNERVGLVVAGCALFAALIAVWQALANGRRAGPM